MLVILTVLFSSLFGQTPPAGYRWDFWTEWTGVSPVAVSDDGRITGNSHDGQGFLRNAGGSGVLFSVPGARTTTVSDVNTAGTVVGSWVDAARVTRGFIRQANGTFTIVEAPGASRTALTGINDSGQVTGTATLASIERSFLRSEAGQIDFIETTPANLLFQDIMNNGAILALQRVPRPIGFGQAYYSVRPGQSTTQLLECSSSRGGGAFVSMNDRQDVAVDCTDYGPGFFATNRRYVLPRGFPPILLSYSLGLPMAFSLTSLRGINNAGQVTGRGTIRGAAEQDLPVTLTPCTASVTGSAIRIPASGGSGVLSVRAETGCRANILVPGWMRVTEPGRGDSLVTYSVSANFEGAALTGEIRVGASSIAVIQDAPAACGFTLFPSTADFTSAGGSSNLAVSTRSDCTWSIASNAPWITLSAVSGTGVTSLQFSVAPNPGNAIRTGAVSVGNAQFTIRQLGAAGCGVLVNSSSLRLERSAYSDYVTVLTNGSSCQWTVTTTTSWLSLHDSTQSPQVSSLTLTGTRGFYVFHDANPSIGPRTGLVTIGGTSLPVIQEGTGGVGQRFVPTTPCRVADTRPEGNKSAPFGPPAMAANTVRNFPIAGAGCGLPTSVRAYSVNITVVPAGYLAFVTVWPAGNPRPTASTLNSWNGRTVANAAIIPAGANDSISVYVSNDTDVIIDINGYFIEGGNLAFYPVTPCRAADTRTSNNAIPVGGGALTVNMPGSSCGIPASAQAYSLNVTAVPRGYLAYLTAWPTGSERPFVSTLNSWNGQVVANAAIVPAGTNGSVSFYSPNATDVVVDVNGYFAPPGPGGLNYFPMNPCRVADTRIGEGRTGPFGLPTPLTQTMRSIPMPDSVCGVPAEARAYSLNMTAVPAGYLGYLTTWPTGVNQPFVSTLNSWDGQVTANAALVPAGTNGAISYYVSNTTDVVIDINGLFLPF